MRFGVVGIGVSMTTIYPVIMCGGAGTRLWPLSRKDRPKQYQALIGDRSMLAETIARAERAPSSLKIAAPTMICGEGQEKLADTESRNAGWPPRAIIVEPFGRNTAAVAAIAALDIAASDPEGAVLLLPADHHMTHPEGLWSGVEAGLSAALNGRIVTLGIQPDGPETGYGYISCGEAIGDKVYEVSAFKEKPDALTAQRYLKSGGYFWNAGIFLFSAKSMITEFEALGPDILKACDSALSKSARDGVFRYLDQEAFEACRSKPVDIEIMERTERAAIVAPVEAGWDDIGSWAALSALKHELNGLESSSPSEGDVLAINCEGGMIRSDGPFVAAIGLQNVVVIAEGGAVLVVAEDQAQSVKDVVKQLKSAKRTELL